ncbi:MAG: DMT family transporter [Euryarchaeota archaeon]|nr:DMT family transporter [Euryarchaeota archaeon]
MNPILVGEAAAVLTSVLWTTCSILFASAGERIGVFPLNALRIGTALLTAAVVHLIVFGSIVPTATLPQWKYMALSGVMGLALGDFGYLGALVLIGPRKGVLLMSMAPIFSTISAYFILGEALGLWAIIGITVTLSGVIIVVMERGKKSREVVSSKKEILGIILGIGGSVGQGVGLVISKYGMLVVESTALNPLSATLIRMMAAMVVVWIVVFIVKKPFDVLKSYRDIRAVAYTVSGAISGPFLGMWLSMVAVTYAMTGVASTLMSLMPVMIIPVVWVLYGEKTSLWGVFGAIIAVVGVAILFMN